MILTVGVLRYGELVVYRPEPCTPRYLSIRKTMRSSWRTVRSPTLNQKGTTFIEEYEESPWRGGVMEIITIRASDHDSTESSVGRRPRSSCTQRKAYQTHDAALLRDQFYQRCPHRCGKWRTNYRGDYFSVHTKSSCPPELICGSSTSTAWASKDGTRHYELTPARARAHDPPCRFPRPISCSDSQGTADGAVSRKCPCRSRAQRLTEDSYQGGNGG